MSSRTREMILEGFAEVVENTMQMCGSVEMAKREYLLEHRDIINRADLDKIHFEVCQQWARCKEEIDAEGGAL